jgi:AcrR family transcriptional regulator
MPDHAHRLPAARRLIIPADRAEVAATCGDILNRMPRRSSKGESGAEPSATLRSQHAEATRRAVLTAARALFGAKGYTQTSVDEIADAARVTKGAVYHHFAGKEALFRAVHAEVEAEAQARALAAGDPREPPLDQLVAKMNAYLDAALDEEIRRITLIDGPAMLGLEPDAPADQQPAYVGLRLFIATAIAHGQIADLDPGVLTDLIGGLAWLGGHLIARASDPDVTRAALGEALDAMLRGLAPGKRS